MLVVAAQIIQQNLELLSTLGKQPHWLFKSVYRLLTKIPYEASQVEKDVEANSRKFLLSEQHLSGGCLFGSVLSTGDDDPRDTGKVHGATNVHVADLSAVPLPHISPQMTAYLIGFHVSHQLCSLDNKLSDKER